MPSLFCLLLLVGSLLTQINDFHLNPCLRACFWGINLTGGTVATNPPAIAGDMGDVGSSPFMGRSPGVGNGIPLQYYYLGNPTGRGPFGLQSSGLQRLGHD